LYEDIRDHERAWFAIFADDDNFVYAERCVGILGTLATILRQQGELLQAQEVLTLDKRVIDV